MRFSPALLALISVVAAKPQYGGSSSSGDEDDSSSGGSGAVTPGAQVVSVSNEGGSIAFIPNTLTAEVGSKVEFHFWPQNHSVVQGTFDQPCWPAGSAAFYSGYVPVTSGMSDRVFTITIKNTDPIWFYCSQEGHCEGGMVGVINPEKGGSTLSQYKAGAAKAQRVETPKEPQGGQWVMEGGGGSQNNTGPSSSSTPDAANMHSVSGGLVGGLAGLAAWFML